MGNSSQPFSIFLRMNNLVFLGEKSKFQTHLRKNLKMRSFYLDEEKSWFLHTSKTLRYEVIDGYEQCSHAARQLVLVRYIDSGRIQAFNYYSLGVAADGETKIILPGEDTLNAATRMIQKVWPKSIGAAVSIKNITGHRDSWYAHLE
jgi:hypothetical protein